MLAWASAMIAGLSILVQVLTAGLGMLACQAAADHALQATRVAGGTPVAGQADARQVLNQIAGHLLRDPQIDVTRTPGTTSVVRVTATALPVLPVLRIPLTATSSGPTEPNVVQP